MKRAGCIAAAALALAGCRKEDDRPPLEPRVGELSVQVVVPPGFDALEDVAYWRVYVLAADGSTLLSADIERGEPVRLDGLSPVDDVRIRIESYDTQDERLAHGRTEPVDLTVEATQAPLYFAPPRSAYQVDGDEAGNLAPAVLGLSDGRVLIAGGLEGDLDGADDVQLYDPRTNQLTDLDPLEVTQRFPAVFSPAPDVLVLAGGWDDGGDALDLTRIFRYEPALGTGSWSEGASLSEPRAEAAAVALDATRTLLVAGTSGDGYLDTTEIFTWGEPGGAWTPGATGRIRASSVAIPLGGGRALVAGGRDDGGSMSNISLYVSDPGGDTLASVPGDSLDSSRAWPSVLAVTGTSWLIAGGTNTAGEPRDSTELLVWDEVAGSVTRSPGPDMPTARRRGGTGHDAAGRPILAGGDTGGGLFDLQPIDEALVYEEGELVPFDANLGDTVTCAMVPLPDGTTLFVTDDDVLRYNPD